jgi:hypothetical protein
MKLDSLVIHADDIGDVVGKFYDSEVRETNLLTVELREISDAQLSARIALGSQSANIELLPGETIVGCRIRRVTSSEAIGEAFYAKDVPEGRQIPLNEVPNENGTLVTWRPNNSDFAVLHEEI